MSRFDEMLRDFRHRRAFDAFALEVAEMIEQLEADLYAKLSEHVGAYHGGEQRASMARPLRVHRAAQPAPESVDEPECSECKFSRGVAAAVK